eukprot:Rhum_TRINITY_DN14699_c2_g1::Rhum_TRINITY_DN14699_c2_g1_i2::g.108413::m.108413/K15111/SLC25A26; solute carrier family 25 (mitochondrial S-adenosylmethionine transporter), member 26
MEVVVMVPCLGGLTGLVAASATHPLDTLKARKITGLRQDSFQGLYRGFGSVAVLSTIGNGLYFGAYEISLLSLKERGYGTVAAPFLAGMAANTLTLSVWVPRDVLKERQQVFSKKEYPGMMSSARRVVALHGPMGLYRGFARSFLMYTPLCALCFVFYEQFKLSAAARYACSQDELGMALYAAGGGLSGGVAAALTTPLDVLKVTLQVSDAKEGVRDVLGSPSRMFRGVTYRVAAVAPMYALTIALWEECRVAIARALPSSDDA